MENTDEYKLKPRHVAVTTDVLAFLNSLAMLHGYEKVIYPQFFSVYNMYDIDSRDEKDRVYADSKYPCTLMMAMPNNTRNDTPCEEHIRTMWRVVTRGENEHGTLNTIDVWIDIPVEAYDSLPDVPESMVVYDSLIDLTQLNMKLGKDEVPVVSLEELRNNEKLVSDIENYLSMKEEE